MLQGVAIDRWLQRLQTGSAADELWGQGERPTTVIAESTGRDQLFFDQLMGDLFCVHGPRTVIGRPSHNRSEKTEKDDPTPQSRGLQPARGSSHAPA